MKESQATNSILKEIPTVDWVDLDRDRSKFMDDLRYALSECGFLVLTNARAWKMIFNSKRLKRYEGFLMHRWM